MGYVALIFSVLLLPVLYSGFLLWNADGMDHPDRDKCIQRFPQFLEMQEKAIFDAMVNGDPTGNFGLKEFLAANVGQKPA